jgi:hypothetical protein
MYTCSSAIGSADHRNCLGRFLIQRLTMPEFRRETVILKFVRTCDILAALDILVDIGVHAEKEVIQ